MPADKHNFRGDQRGYSFYEGSEITREDVIAEAKTRLEQQGGYPDPQAKTMDNLRKAMAAIRSVLESKGIDLSSIGNSLRQEIIDDAMKILKMFDIE